MTLQFQIVPVVSCPFALICHSRFWNCHKGLSLQLGLSILSCFLLSQTLSCNFSILIILFYCSDGPCLWQRCLGNPDFPGHFLSILLLIRYNTTFPVCLRLYYCAFFSSFGLFSAMSDVPWEHYNDSFLIRGFWHLSWHVWYSISLLGPRVEVGKFFAPFLPFSLGCNPSFFLFSLTLLAAHFFEQWPPLVLCLCFQFYFLLLDIEDQLTLPDLLKLKKTNIIFILSNGLLNNNEPQRFELVNQYQCTVLKHRTCCCRIVIIIALFWFYFLINILLVQKRLCCTIIF